MSTQAPNLHLPHLEDVPLIQGRAGHLNAVEIILHATSYMQSGVMPRAFSLSEKFDGAPAICFGRQVDGRFWIGTKSALAVRKPVWYHTTKAINSDASLVPDLKRKLGTALDYLQTMHVDSSKIYCADLAFALPDKSLHARNPYGAGPFFQPNTLGYLPISKALSSKISSARVGVVVHTIRNTNNHAIMEAAPEGQFLLAPDGVWLASASLPRNLNASYRPYASCALEVSRICQHVNEPLLETLDVISSERLLLEAFLYIQANRTYAKLRSGDPLTGQEIIEKLQERLEKDIPKLKTAKGRTQARRNSQKLLSLITSVSAQRVIVYCDSIAEARNKLAEQLPRGLGLQASVSHKKLGELQCGGEGFVAHLTHRDCSAKIVNRQEFSHWNRSPLITKGFERAKRTTKIYDAPGLL